MSDDCDKFVPNLSHLAAVICCLRTSHAATGSHRLMWLQQHRHDLRVRTLQLRPSEEAAVGSFCCELRVLVSLQVVLVVPPSTLQIDAAQPPSRCAGAFTSSRSAVNGCWCRTSITAAAYTFVMQGHCRSRVRSVRLRCSTCTALPFFWSPLGRPSATFKTHTDWVHISIIAGCIVCTERLQLPLYIVTIVLSSLVTF